MPTDAVPATVWSALSGPWHDATVVRAFAEVAVVGAVGGVLGCWIVLYGLSYSAEALSTRSSRSIIIKTTWRLSGLASAAAAAAVSPSTAASSR